ncbi:hypothetical protein [Dyadobacter sandarakinus]|uniref:Uncharacterized protein n=1 Tax=Dyadobacter sandarakinus TaxID=2747268 RepID=A0ABX7I6Q5_9BACT|nr:hypothetical protein [Dyadobacter sandarakinus]QRR01152.1 hypothetical protein HWI92_09660 [Dyadobacter sandarakinus]
MINPAHFAASRPLNSPLSLVWKSATVAREQLFDAQVDSLSNLFDRGTDSAGVSLLYAHFNERFDALKTRMIDENIKNELGWNLLLRSPETFQEHAIPPLIDRFSKHLATPSFSIVKDRLSQYQKGKSTYKSIYQIFEKVTE